MCCAGWFSFLAAGPPLRPSYNQKLPPCCCWRARRETSASRERMARRTASNPVPLPNQAALEAIATGDVTLVTNWIDGGGSVDGRVQLQTEIGIRVFTPLMLACAAGQMPVIDLLLERGASVHMHCDGITALMAAANAGHPGVVRRLLRVGAQLGVRSHSGYTAQKLAEEEGHHECVCAMREHLEATVAAQLKKATEVSAPAPVAQAATKAKAPSAAAESEGSARGKVLPDELFSSLGHGDVAGVAAWVNGGGQVDYGWLVPNPDPWPDLYDVTTLMCACLMGQLPVVDLLLERGADVDLQDSLGSTALMLAAGKGDAAIVHRMLRAGAQIGVRTRNGRTALMVAEHHGHHKCARILREHDAAMAAEKREHEAATAAEKRARRKEKKRAAKEAAQTASADKAAAVTAAAEAARLEHEETVRRHDEREAAERAEAKAAEEAKRAQVAAQRLAKAQAPPTPLTPASQQPAPKAKAERSARRTEAAELEHQVHIIPEQKTIRAAAFDSRQVVTKEDAAVKKARAQAKALKKASARASAEAEAARHVVPSAPTMSDMMAGVLV